MSWLPILPGSSGILHWRLTRFGKKLFISDFCHIHGSNLISTVIAIVSFSPVFAPERSKCVIGRHIISSFSTNTGICPQFVKLIEWCPFHYRIIRNLEAVPRAMPLDNFIFKFQSVTESNDSAYRLMCIGNQSDCNYHFTQRVPDFFEVATFVEASNAPLFSWPHPHLNPQNLIGIACKEMLSSEHFLLLLLIYHKDSLPGTGHLIKLASETRIKSEFFH